MFGTFEVEVNKSSLQSHHRENIFVCGADRVVLEREDSGSASNTMTSMELYHSYTTCTTWILELNPAICT
jgi:hypothetical protein